MSEPLCPAAIDSRRWIEYWLNELDEAESSPLEAHLFECAICTATLERFAALADSIRSLHRDGCIASIVPAAFVRKMKDAGLLVREYRLAPHGSVYCTVTPRDDFVVGHLEAPLAGVTRLDAILEDMEANSVQRLMDIPFNAAEGGIVLLPAMHEIRPLETQTLRVQIIAVDDVTGERTLGVYTFNHRATDGANDRH